MKQTIKGKVQTTKNAAGAKHSHSIWCILSASVNSRNVVLYPHADGKQFPCVVFLLLQVNVGVRVILFCLYILKQTAAQGFRCKTGLSPCTAPHPLPAGCNSSHSVQTGQLDSGEPSDIWLKMKGLFHHLENLTTAGIIWPDSIQVFI